MQLRKCSSWIHPNSFCPDLSDPTAGISKFGEIRSKFYAMRVAGCQGRAFCSVQSGRSLEDRLLCYSGASLCCGRTNAFFIAARPVGRRRPRISLASSDEVEWPGFCTHSRPKLPLSGHDLSDLSDFGRFSGDLADSTYSRLDWRWLISGGLEQTC